MTEKEIFLFIEKLMDKVVQFFHEKMIITFEGDGYDTDEESFYKALTVVMNTAFVSAEYDSKRLFLYALDPMSFLPVNASGKTELWDYLRSWAKSTNDLELAIGQFYMSEPHGLQVYKHTKDYLLETKRMVDDDAMSFHDAFLNE